MSAAAVQSVLTSLQQNDYVSRAFIPHLGDRHHELTDTTVAIVTAIGYDYSELLTCVFSNAMRQLLHC